MAGLKIDIHLFHLIVNSIGFIFNEFNKIRIKKVGAVTRQLIYDIFVEHIKDIPQKTEILWLLL